VPGLSTFLRSSFDSRDALGVVELGVFLSQSRSVVKDNIAGKIHQLLSLRRLTNKSVDFYMRETKTARYFDSLHSLNGTAVQSQGYISLYKYSAETFNQDLLKKNHYRIA
jgi:hypothetical protein